MDVTPIAALPAAPAQTTDVTVERQLFTYLSDMGQITTGMAPQAADLTALAHQGLEYFRGFIEAAEKWSHGTLVPEMLSQPVGTDLPRGPALASLDPPGSANSFMAAGHQGGPAHAPLTCVAREPGEKPDGFTSSGDLLASLQRTMEVALASSGFSVTATFVTSCTAQISSSIHALTRGP